jgi:hypothetical protein
LYGNEKKQGGGGRMGMITSDKEGRNGWIYSHTKKNKQKQAFK